MTSWLMTLSSATRMRRRRPAGRRGRLAARDRTVRSRGGVELQDEPEGRALARAALEADLAAHLLDDPLADRQARARCRRSAAGWSCRPGRRARRGCPGLGGDADPGVADDELQPAVRERAAPRRRPSPAASVNFTALPTRLVSTWRRRAGIARRPTPARRRRRSRSSAVPLLPAREAAAAPTISRSVPAGRKAPARAPARRPRSWRSPGCRRSAAAARPPSSGSSSA